MSQPPLETHPRTAPGGGSDSDGCRRDADSDRHTHAHSDLANGAFSFPFSPANAPARGPASTSTASQVSPTIGSPHGQSHPRCPARQQQPQSQTQAGSHPKPASSPLHASTATSPPHGASPTTTSFPAPLHRAIASSIPTLSFTPSDTRNPRDSTTGGTTYFNSDSSGPSTPEESNPRPAYFPAHAPNDSRSATNLVVTSRPLAGSTILPKSAAMPAPAAPRNSSMDSAMSSGSRSNKQMAESPQDVASLIKAAGSPEAVIQYLLREKQSQSQQNSQLWRLVDKQRAMILGLNKDLERALKDKEKYRKKLKEVMTLQQIPSVPSMSVHSDGSDASGSSRSKNGGRDVDILLSPTLDSDSQKHSPIEVAMAPYPITPPADQMHMPQSNVGLMLDPTHAMPKAHEHALDQYDHDAQEQAADTARREADAAMELPLNLALPPSRSLPSKPPQGPPPRLPPTSPLPQPSVPDAVGNSQFPPPTAPPPRKLPPAPLQLQDAARSPTFSEGDVLESDSDYDDILEVTEIGDAERRGRRRTRAEDDVEREGLAQKEAELRSLSKKSNKSAKGTPREGELEITLTAVPDVSPTVPTVGLLLRDNHPASLAGILNGESSTLLAPALLSPGLPASPRPMAGMPKSPIHSPPVSPRYNAQVPPAPLSPRPPRQPIPLPPNTPLQTPSPPHKAAEPAGLTSPRPLNIVKKADSVDSASLSQLESPTTRSKVFRGLVTDEYPDLLLPPNALPSVDIKVASSRMKPSRASLIALTQLEEDPVFTLAVFSRSDGGELWRVEKDSASLAKLDHRLKQCPAFTAKTPDRNLFSGHSPAKLDARRLALNYYLDELLNTPLDTPTAIELCKWLSHNTLPPNADETGGNGPDSLIDTSAAKTSSGGRPHKNGYLTKRGKQFGGWKARFFVLDGPHLKYFETPGGAHLGTIKLQAAKIGKQSQNNENESPARPSGANDDIDHQYRHAFLILEPKKKDPTSVTKHVLCAESDHERDQWVDALLRWIDYRDPNDEEVKKEALAPEQSSRSNGASSKKKGQSGKKGAQQPQESDNDSLIGMSYENTQQGQAPTRSKASLEQEAGQSTPSTMSSQGGYSISAPRDAHQIADSIAWTKQIGALAPPTSDEKKARKRSFFGFGTKTRTSSDGQDSLFGEASSNSGSQTLYSGPVRQQFGAPLAEAVRYCSPTDVRVPLPAVVYRCIQYLDANNATLEEGIFRLSGSNVVIKQLRERFNTEGDINLVKDETYHDIHAVASLLKLYLRELPSTILTRDLHMEFLAVTEMTGQKEKLAALAVLAKRLPLANETLLKYLISFLIKIINHADMNKMTVRNVGIVFSPTLNIPAPVFAMFLQNYEAIFGIEPEEYELPSPASEADAASLAGRPSADQYPPRPSTSQASESPHRQRLLESVMGGGQRGSPTPPMGKSQLSNSRGTPTPPPAQQQMGARGYDGHYLAQQQAGPQMTYRAGYDNVAPGYDRPLYDNPGSSGLAPYDNGYTSNKSARRESAMFMGSMSLSQQGSKSRLREESHY